MIRYENECCDCATDAYPCIGDMCERRHVMRVECDECGDETNCYDYDGKQYCKECLIEHLLEDGVIERCEDEE